MIRKWLIAAVLLLMLLPLYAAGDELTDAAPVEPALPGSAVCAHENCVPLATGGHMCLVCGNVLEHTMTENIVPATCMTVGYTEDVCLYCGCSMGQHDFVAPSSEGHVWGNERIETAATCAREGTAVRECELCGAKETVKIPLAEHTPVTYETLPDCTHDGMVTVVCAVCGTEISSQRGEAHSALYHKWGEWVTESVPSCVTAGSEKRVCAVCGAEHRREIEPTGHTVTEQVFEPKEGADGYTADVCAECGAEIGERRDITHYPCETPETVEPTCARDGSATVKCANCGEILSQEILPPTGEHEWGAYRVVTEPSCTASGENVRECAVCGLTEKKYTAAAGHDVQEVTVEPRGLSIGYTVDKCTVCGIETGVRHNVVSAPLSLADMTKVDEEFTTYTEGITAVSVYETETADGIVRAVCMEAGDEAVIDMSGIDADEVYITHGGVTLTICAPGALTVGITFAENDAYTVKCVLTGVEGENGEYTAVCGDEGGAIYRGYVTMSTETAGVTLTLIEEYPG